jgi:hypothetical protein
LPRRFHLVVNFAIVAPMRQMTSSELYVRLLRFVMPYWRVFALALLGMVIVALTAA